MMNNIILNSLSTVVVSKNDFLGLKKTLESFSNIDHDNLNIILVLSEFNDHQINTIRSEFRTLAFEIYISPAEGPYAAMNFGLSQVQTEFVNFLNGGDTFTEGSNLIELLSTMNGSLIGYGEIEILGNSDNESIRYSFRKYSRIFHRLGIKFIPHPATIISVQAARNLGGFDLNYPVSADQKMAMLLTKHSKPIISKGLIAQFERGGLSTRSPSDIVKDFRNISHEIYGFVGKYYLIDALFWKIILALRITFIFMLRRP